MKRTSRAIAALVIAVMLLAAAGCGGGGGTSTKSSGSVPTGEPYKIGVIVSLTGTYAALGSSERNALELEKRRINDAGGINGRPIDLVIEDDGTDEAKAVAAASKLIEQDKVVAIIGASGTGQSMAVRGDVERAGIPQISMAGGTAITAKFSSLVYQTPWSNTIVVPFVLDKIKADGYTKIGLLSDSGGYGKDGRDVILKDAPKVGIEIVSDQPFNVGDTDMTTQLTKINQSGAQALLMWTAGKESVTIAKNREQLGMTMPWYGGSGQARAEFPKGAGAAAQGFIFGTGKSLVPRTWGEGTEEFKVVSEFATRYKVAYAEDPDIFAGHAYDAIRILADALDRAPDDADGEALNSAIESTKDLVGFGGNFTFSPTDHNGLTSEDLQLYEIDNGAWVPLK